ncbi:MAG: hypothetical protein ACLQRM_20410 [Acidimicrobiales bacterium]|jgi:hypothetical protein
MLVTPAGQSARPDDVWAQDLHVSVLNERRTTRTRVSRPQTTVVACLLVAAGGIATFDLYLLATSGLH